jgi:hypothetical protein
MPAVITAEAFARALAGAGVIHDIHRVRRVVVDAEAGSAVRVYVERYGDERLLNVVPTLNGIEIIGVPAGPANDERRER